MRARASRNVCNEIADTRHTPCEEVAPRRRSCTRRGAKAAKEDEAVQRRQAEEVVEEEEDEEEEDDDEEEEVTTLNAGPHQGVGWARAAGRVCARAYVRARLHGCCAVVLMLFRKGRMKHLRLTRTHGTPTRSMRAHTHSHLNPPIVDAGGGQFRGWRR